jgi:hypothetical protein
MVSSIALRIFAGVFLLGALFLGCAAVAQENASSGPEGQAKWPAMEPPQFVKPPQVVPAHVIPIVMELAKQTSLNPIPLKYVTSSDPTQQSSFSTHSLVPFTYRGQGYLLSIPYNTAAYESTKTTYPQRAEDRFRETAGLVTLMPNDWWTVLPTSLNWVWWFSQINDPAQDELYDSTISQLSTIRNQYNLTDDEYAELIARFVQRAVPNGHQPFIEKYPIETIAERNGGQKDKAMLLAGLLCHAGFGSAIIYFPLANTFVVGVPGDGRTNEYDGYIAIDPTRETYFGFDDARETSVRALSSFYGTSAVGPVCDGKGFTSGKEVGLIQDTYLIDRYFKDIKEFEHDLLYVEQNSDNRHLVYQYLAETGPYRYFSS